MKQKPNWFAGLFAAVMLVFSVLTAWYVIQRSALDFTLADTAISLETNRGRERKQQYEFDKVSEDLPLTREELEKTLPLAETAAQEVQALKEERRKLRAEKKELEEALAQRENSEGTEEAPAREGGTAE